MIGTRFLICWCVRLQISKEEDWNDRSQNLHVKRKTGKLLEKNIREKSSWFIYRQKAHTDTKNTTHKREIYKLDIIKIKHFFSKKDIIQRWKYELWTGRKYFQAIYLTNIYYQEYNWPLSTGLKCMSPLIHRLISINTIAVHDLHAVGWIQVEGRLQSYPWIFNCVRSGGP